MKNKIRVFALLLMLSFTALTASAKEYATEQQKEMRVTEIRQRVEQIRAMDMSHLDKIERRDMRHELKGMNKELREMGPGIYISVGALIIIILLLILIL